MVTNREANRNADNDDACSERSCDGESNHDNDNNQASSEEADPSGDMVEGFNGAIVDRTDSVVAAAADSADATEPVLSTAIPLNPSNNSTVAEAGAQSIICAPDSSAVANGNREQGQLEPDTSINNETRQLIDRNQSVEDDDTIDPASIWDYLNQYHTIDDLLSEFPVDDSSTGVEAGEMDVPSESRPTNTIAEPLRQPSLSVLAIGNFLRAHVPFLPEEDVHNLAAVVTNHRTDGSSASIRDQILQYYIRLYGDTWPDTLIPLFTWLTPPGQPADPMLDAEKHTEKRDNVSSNERRPKKRKGPYRCGDCGEFKVQKGKPHICTALPNIGYNLDSIPPAVVPTSTSTATPPTAAPIAQNITTADKKIASSTGRNKRGNYKCGSCQKPLVTVDENGMRLPHVCEFKPKFLKRYERGRRNHGRSAFSGGDRKPAPVNRDDRPSGLQIGDQKETAVGRDDSRACIPVGDRKPAAVSKGSPANDDRKPAPVSNVSPADYDRNSAATSASGSRDRMSGAVLSGRTPPASASTELNRIPRTAGLDPELTRQSSRSQPQKKDEAKPPDGDSSVTNDAGVEELPLRSQVSPEASAIPQRSILSFSPRLRWEAHRPHRVRSVARFVAWTPF